MTDLTAAVERIRLTTPLDRVMATLVVTDLHDWGHPMEGLLTDDPQDLINRWRFLRVEEIRDALAVNTMHAQRRGKWDALEQAARQAFDAARRDPRADVAAIVAGWDIGRRP